MRYELLEPSDLSAAAAPLAGARRRVETLGRGIRVSTLRETEIGIRGEWRSVVAPPITLLVAIDPPFGGRKFQARLTSFIQIRKPSIRRRKIVKKLILLMTMLAMTLTATVPALAQDASSGSASVSGDQSAQSSTDAANSIRGTLTSISGSVVLVEEDPADESGSAKGAFTVTDETRIYKRQGDKQVAAALEDLKVGQTVLATYAGPVAESYPTQGEAESIVILEESSGDDDPRCLLPEGCNTGGEVVATGVVEKAEATSYQYGTHALVDGGTGETIYALTSESVDLGAYEGELVTIYGTYVAGYENGVDGGPPLVEVDRVETAPDGSEETVTASFELTVEGDPPAGTTFFGEVGLGTRGKSVQLTDPDGDGVYTGSLKVERGTQRGAWIEQGTGRLIKDFGLVTFDADKTFSASISFEDGGSGDGGSNGGDSGDGDSSNNGVNTGGKKAKELPKTGGAVLTLLGVGALLIVGGTLTRRFLPSR